MMRLRSFLASLVVLLMPVMAHADSFTYNFNQTFSSFSVTGTITTDKDSGSIYSPDITGYNLVLSDGTSTQNLTSDSAGQRVFNTSALTATPVGLFFDFSNTYYGKFLIPYPSFAGGTSLCFQGVNDPCDEFSGGNESVAIGSDGPKVENLSGNVQIASVNSPVPEPESLALLGTGLFGLVGIVRRRVVR